LKFAKRRHSQALKLKIVLAGCFLLALLAGLPIGHASADVESRIVSAIDWINGQETSNSRYVGFARGVATPDNQTIFTEDQALIALALSDYHFTHYSDQYDNLLSVAVSLAMSARTTSGDFYEYYDLRSGQWFHAGGLYPWDAYAIAGLASAAYKVSYNNYSQLVFWAPIEMKLKEAVDNTLHSQRDDGAWLFRSTHGSSRDALTRENAILLVGLLYLGLFESELGSKQQATYYGQLSEKTARWLFSMQDNNSALPTFGGFPHSDSNSTQTTEENGEVLLGVDTYYSIIGVLLPEASPSIFDARRVMTDWVSGFAEKMRDSFGGFYNGRTQNSLVQYPKTTRAAAWMLQALADIWVNLGGPRYYGDSQKPYDWIVGGNELRADLQGASSISGAMGGFYGGIDKGTLDQATRTDVTASALYALVRAAFILVPEFPAGTGAILLFLGVCAALAVNGRRVRKRPD
jgi:hypothetical protein